MNGTGSVTSMFARNMTWEIVGHSAVSRTFANSRAFIDEVLRPFGTLFSATDPFRPVGIRGLYADDVQDTVIVVWDGRGTTTDGDTYSNTYAWILTLAGGEVVEGTAFYDSISFNELWKKLPASA